MEKMNNTTDFDANVDRFLRHQMTCDEEGHFKAELLADPDKKERARIIALMVKSMRQEGLKQDQAIVDKIYNMDENQFRGAAHLKGRSLKMWFRLSKYVAAACVVGFLLFGGHHYYERQQTVSLGNKFYFEYTLDISEDMNVRGIKQDESIYVELNVLFSNVREGIEVKSSIEKLQSIYIDSSQDDSPYNDFQDDIAWNLAIAYLKTGDRKRPVQILEEMIERNAEYPQVVQPAQKLLELIEAF